MSWRQEKTSEGSDLVWDGVEKGIAPSPTTGTANIQNANISTETGEVMASYGRVAQQQVAISGGTLTASGGDGTTKLVAPSNLKGGQFISVSAATVTIAGPTAPIDYLVVGGAASGGATAASNSGGGGGAGDVKPGSTTVAVGVYAVTIGNGGAAAAAGFNDGLNGASSSLGAIATATGGSKGGAGNGGGGVANPGGSGSASGGGGGAASGGGTGGAAGTAGAGTNVHNGAAGNNTGTAGGGGGAGTAASGNTGGTGFASSISGASVNYGVGGNGDGTGTAGTANRGNGGNGTSNGANPSGAGGSGVVIIRYLTTDLTATGGTITTDGAYTVHTFTTSGNFNANVIGYQIALPNGNYFVDYKDSSNKVKISYYYDPYGLNPITHSTSGTITFSTLATISSGIAKATEKYGTATGTEYRYYVLDTNGYVWVYDTAVYDSTLAANGIGMTWMLPDASSYDSTYSFSGLTVLNGNVLAFGYRRIYSKPTVNLGTTFLSLTNMRLSNPFTQVSHPAITGHQGKAFYCDGNYVGEIFPTTSFETSLANVQSYAQYTSVSDTGTMTAVISGSAPYTLDANGAVARIPAVFFTDVYGTQPTNLTANVVYYIECQTTNVATFKVYAAITGGGAIDITTGAAGNQYFNTFFPTSTHAGANGDHTLVQFTGQRVNLPSFEVSKCLVEVGNTVLIGGITNVVYPWNEVDAVPSDLIFLPESNTVAMVNANNMAYIFAGNKGNVYISNGSVASHAMTIPDYCAGVPGTPLTYIEPVFIWGDASYVRGRIYCSILDQTSTKAGNCGGVWSFVPTQNLYIGEDVGMALRLENQNSYGSYNGMATLIIPNERQNVISPQYWSFWQDSYSTGISNFGVDYTATTPVTKFVVETDLLPTGSFLSKDTFQQLEYKLTTPATSGDSTQIYYRLNSTDVWTSCGTVKLETTNPISGYFDVNFQKTQWVQFRTECTTGGTTSSSFNRLKQLMFR